MTIKRNITVLEKLITPIIDITYGTDLIPIEITIEDYELPSNSTAQAYAIGNDGDARRQECTVIENTISFTPEVGFFTEGKNLLQIEIESGGKNLTTFSIKVECEKQLSRTAGQVFDEAVLEEITITENGVHVPSEGVDGFSKVTVSVKLNLQEKTVTENGEVVADAGFDALSKVTVNVQPKLQTKTFNENGVFTPDAGYQGFSSVTVDTPVAPEYKHIEGVGF